MDGHIGVYIGNGEVIEAQGTAYGVVKTKLEGRGWTKWLKIPNIKYVEVKSK
jgi:cell wall-associated NlpC family hydrolase